MIPAKAMPRPLSLSGAALILLSDKIPNAKAMGNSGSPKGGSGSPKGGSGSRPPDSLSEKNFKQPPIKQTREAIA